MKIIKQTYLISAPIEKVWQALVDPRQIDGWGAGPAKMEDKEGFKFSLWGGEIYGKNTVVIPNKKLVQEWFDNASNWDKPSLATFILTKAKDGTKLELIHENVPDKNFKDIDEGWKDFYLGSLKDYLEEK